MSEPDFVVPLERSRLGQNEAAVKTYAINAVACRYCEAEIGQPCHRLGVDGRRHELIYVHPCRTADADRLQAEGETDA